MSRKNNNYERVMTRVFNTSGVMSNSSVVMRHDLPSSFVKNNAKFRNSDDVSKVFTDLPIVLNQYAPECNMETMRKRSIVIKPRKTVKSLNPTKVSSLYNKSRNIGDNSRRSCVNDNAISSVLYSNLNSQCRSLKPCYSTSSLNKLKELKDEISAFHDQDKLSKFQSRLHELCGIEIDNECKLKLDKSEENITDQSSFNSNRTISHFDAARILECGGRLNGWSKLLVLLCLYAFYNNKSFS